MQTGRGLKLTVGAAASRLQAIDAAIVKLESGLPGRVGTLAVGGGGDFGRGSSGIYLSLLPETSDGLVSTRSEPRLGPIRALMISRGTPCKDDGTCGSVMRYVSIGHFILGASAYNRADALAGFSLDNQGNYYG